MMLFITVYHMYYLFKINLVGGEALTSFIDELIFSRVRLIQGKVLSQCRRNNTVPRVKKLYLGRRGPTRGKREIKGRKRRKKL